MPREEFKPTIPVFEWPKTVLALDRTAIETGPFHPHSKYLLQKSCMFPLQSQDFESNALLQPHSMK